MKRTALISASLLLLNLAACVLPDKTVGDDDAADGETGDGDGDPSPGDGDGEPGDGDGDPPTECEGPFPFPGVDPDCDGFSVVCDNANDHHNPGQIDQDNDGVGDVADSCPLIPGDAEAGLVHGDEDRDGIGNECDRCQHAAEHYQAVIDDPRLWVRNVPTNADLDQDGVGDACDNCVAVANCMNFGPDNPAPHGAQAEDLDLDLCQADEDDDGIGDACIDPETMSPINGPTAAGPVGFEPSDDFDQDGITNFEDACSRLPVENRIACTEDADCNAGSPNSSICAPTAANDGKHYCNHPDLDGDFVGDACDTCLANANPMQVTDTGMLIDDEDGDFVGSACEASSFCEIRADARPIGFYAESVRGECCVTTYPGDDALHDPDGVPIRVECSDAEEAADVCRRLPASVAASSGVVSLPPGCDGEATELTLADVGGDPLALWEHACRMPALDQDFDGIGDACDLCPFAFDPSNTPYVDDDNMQWPDAGAACSGDLGGEHFRGAMCEP